MSVSDPPPVDPTAVGAFTPTPPKSKRWRKILLTGLIVAVCGMCLCVGLASWSLYQAGVAMTAAKPRIGATLDAFMVAMVAEDADAAYALFSTRSKRNVPLSVIEQMLSGNNYTLFEGYRSYTLGNIQLSTTVNTNPDVAQGNVATVSGQFLYDGDFTGSFSAILEYEDDEWRLHYINITVPPAKLSP